MFKSIICKHKFLIGIYNERERGYNVKKRVGGGNSIINQNKQNKQSRRKKNGKCEVD